MAVVVAVVVAVVWQSSGSRVAVAWQSCGSAPVRSSPALPGPAWTRPARPGLAWPRLSWPGQAFRATFQRRFPLLLSAFAHGLLVAPHGARNKKNMHFDHMFEASYDFHVALFDRFANKAHSNQLKNARLAEESN